MTVMWFSKTIEDNDRTVESLGFGVCVCYDDSRDACGKCCLQTAV